MGTGYFVLGFFFVSSSLVFSLVVWQVASSSSSSTRNVVRHHGGQRAAIHPLAGEPRLLHPQGAHVEDQGSRVVECVCGSNKFAIHCLTGEKSTSLSSAASSAWQVWIATDVLLCKSWLALSGGLANCDAGAKCQNVRNSRLKGQKARKARPKGQNETNQPFPRGGAGVGKFLWV